MKLVVPYHPPLDWGALLEFVGRRCTAGVEQVEAGTYRRTVRLGKRTGWVCVDHHVGAQAVRIELSASLAPVQDEVVARLRAMLDLDMSPEVVARALGRDPLLGPSLRRNPGLRIAGAFDGFESAVRVVLGQQVSVAAATTISGRLARALGGAIRTPFQGLDRLSAIPAAILAAGEDRIAGLGMPGARARTLVALARAHVDGVLELHPGAPLAITRERLLEIPGVGPWTAEVVAMRSLGAADAFPAGDLGVLRALGTRSIREAEARAELWRPWRAYAAMHLWDTLARGGGA